MTINEVRRRLQLFAKEHGGDSDEKQHAQQFWRDLYACFGLSKSSAAMFEARVIKTSGTRGYIDSFIPSVLLVEQKSLGRNLLEAYKQAQDYFHALENEFEKPQYIICCDFQTFHLYNLHGKDTDVSNSKTPAICTLQDLHKRADWFMFLAQDKRVSAVVEELPVNRKAAEQISKLHDGLLRSGYKGRDLETFLTRLLFCLFADDTGIFGRDGIFKQLIASAREDGGDLGSRLSLLFEVLNTPRKDRQTRLDEALNEFEYINGDLFAERLSTPIFDFDLRTLLVNCSAIDWSAISPAIFGSMFQGVLESGATDNAKRKETRRELGAHYTSERNIFKVIEPLFLKQLHSDYEKARANKAKLRDLYDRLPTIKFFDPACGCGNFLVIAYRELRRIENDVINDLFFKGEQGGLLDISTLCRVNVSQFYGIEIDEAAVHIARVALYITDHQMNLEAAKRFGETRPTVPLVTTPHITHANALRIKWDDVLDPRECTYVFGNPPFLGKQHQTEKQKEDFEFVSGKLKNFALLDYVAAWYIKATEYINDTNVAVAFVSTNSITQGEQVAVLWPWLIKNGIHINFAHRTFKWSNEGKANAAVHCVIVGFGKFSSKRKVIYDYLDGDASIRELEAETINPYLVDAPVLIIEPRRQAVCEVPQIVFGNMANDGGHFFLTTDEKESLIAKFPHSAKYIKKFLGADEFINRIDRWCLWLVDVSAEEIRAIPPIYERVREVQRLRQESKRLATNVLAATPYLFGEIRQTNEPYILIPRHSSETRNYIPIGFFGNEVICGDANCMIPNATLREFSILTSKMHMAWVRTVCGRIKSDFRYSNTVVYNNFIWPDLCDEPISTRLTESAQHILDIRAQFPSASLADLYDPVTMPRALVQAHEVNNRVVDEAYRYKGVDDDAGRVSFLFRRYQEQTSLLPVNEKKNKRRKPDIRGQIGFL
jgi:type I restriction-modification system DNA methylase subunit